VNEGLSGSGKGTISGSYKSFPYGFSSVVTQSTTGFSSSLLTSVQGV
jgi:hypothetical protein